MIKTIWQPVKPWNVPIKQLERAKFPKKEDEYKRKRNDQKNSENGYSIFNWDAEYASIVKFYAQLALAPGWIEYTRDLVKQKQQTEPLFKNLGKDVAEKIKELKDEKSK